MKIIRTIAIVGIWLVGFNLSNIKDMCNGYFFCEYIPFPLIWILMVVFIGLVFFDYKKVWKEGMHRLHYPNDKSSSDEK